MVVCDILLGVAVPSISTDGSIVLCFPSSAVGGGRASN